MAANLRIDEVGPLQKGSYGGGGCFQRLNPEILPQFSDILPAGQLTTLLKCEILFIAWRQLNDRLHPSLEAKTHTLEALEGRPNEVQSCVQTLFAHPRHEIIAPESLCLRG